MIENKHRFRTGGLALVEIKSWDRWGQTRFQVDGESDDCGVWCLEFEQLERDKQKSRNKYRICSYLDKGQRHPKAKDNVPSSHSFHRLSPFFAPSSSAVPSRDFSSCWMGGALDADVGFILFGCYLLANQSLDLFNRILLGCEWKPRTQNANEVEQMS